MRKVLLSLFMVVATFVATAQTCEYWERPEVFQINKLPARATLLPYATATDALVRGESEWVKDISGEWKFHWSATPADAPEGFDVGVVLPAFDLGQVAAGDDGEAGQHLLGHSALKAQPADDPPGDSVVVALRHVHRSF